MLSRLYIRNYAIIREIDVRFEKGLNIITGETGAGKSILVGALGLILGERADSSVLLDTSQKCLVEGFFQYPDHPSLEAFFKEQDIERDSELILRREISSAGKSRAFINDTPVNLTQLQQLAALLVDLHQQFDTLELGQNSFQLDILDALASQLPMRKELAQTYLQYRSALQVWKELEAFKEKEQKEFDYFNFLFTELEEAALKPGEIEALEQELGMLEHAGQVTTVLQKVNHLLDSADQPVTQTIRSLVHQLETIAAYHPQISSLAERLRSAQIELKDIADETDRISSGVSMDESRQQEVNDRLSVVYKLCKKHQVKSTDELLHIQEGLFSRISKVANLENELHAAAKETVRLKKLAEDVATKISNGRRKVIPGFEKHVQKLLERVGMPNARMSIQAEKDELSLSGIDKVEFLFDANKSGKFESLRKVASGGEFSRLLLCIKTLVGDSLSMPVMIFDEIDSGISGEAAKQVGLLMKEMGKGHQVISITHQPQIAAQADAHFYVFKQESDGAIRTQLRRLEQDERIRSIAQMMSGENPSEAALNNARELITAG